MENLERDERDRNLALKMQQREKNIKKEILKKASDNLIEKIIIYYAKRVSEKMIKDNIDYYNICSNELKNY